MGAWLLFWCLILYELHDRGWVWVNPSLPLWCLLSYDLNDSDSKMALGFTHHIRCYKIFSESIQGVFVRIIQLNPLADPTPKPSSYIVQIALHPPSIASDWQQCRSMIRSLPTGNGFLEID